MSLFKTAALAVALNSCALLGADFFPLQDGNTWTYREPVTGQTFTVRVGQTVTNAGNVYYKLSGYADAELLVRIEPVYGALMYWDEARNQEILLTSFEQFEGGYWSAPFRPCPDQAGQTQLKRGNHSGPAGPVSDVLEIRYRAPGCADVGAVQEQYAEHLGMLRRIQTSIAGPRTFDLISARVGTLTIDAAPAARFSVSVGPTVGPGPVSATLRLQVNSPAPLTLSFTSGQEYDLALNDSAGNTHLDMVRQQDILTSAAPAHGHGRMERNRRNSVARGPSQEVCSPATTPSAQRSQLPRPRLSLPLCR